MKYSDELINNLINEEIIFSNNIALKYNYPDNITHLLYIIIPAFILKYGIKNKHLIEKCFSIVPIVINDKQDKIYQAYYFSKPNYIDNKIVTTKGIVLNNYENISLIQLLDNLIHEFNHAINSVQNEIKITDYVLTRTGISYNYFDKQTLKFLRKSEETILEEVINTKQTETIINIIKSFSNYQIESTIVSNTLYSINHLVDSNYSSNSYLLESLICRKLLENKTFISTVENLRFQGQIDDINYFFDSITGKANSLLELAKMLNRTLDIQKQIPTTKLFKNNKISKLKKINDEALKIIEKFNQNTIYK